MLKFFLSFFLILVFFLTIPKIILAESDPIKFTPQVPVGEMNKEVVFDKQGNNYLGTYILGLYNYGLGIVGITAALVIVFAGLLWTIGGGAPSQVNNAQEWLKAAIVGLVLLMISYLILDTINPDTLVIKPLNPTVVEKVPAEEQKVKDIEQKVKTGEGEKIKILEDKRIELAKISINIASSGGSEEEKAIAQTKLEAAIREEKAQRAASTKIISDNTSGCCQTNTVNSTAWFNNINTDCNYTVKKSCAKVTMIFHEGKSCKDFSFCK